MSPRGYHLEAIFASHFDQSHPRSCDECPCSKCNGSPSRFSSEFLDEIIRYRWIYIAALLQVHTQGAQVWITQFYLQNKLHHTCFYCVSMHKTLLPFFSHVLCETVKCLNKLRRH